MLLDPGCVRGVLVGTVDRGVHRHRPVDVTGGIGLSEDLPGHGVLGAVGGIPALAFPHCLPRAEAFGQVTSDYARAVPVDDALDDSAVVAEMSALSAGRGRQHRFDVGPLAVGELLEAVGGHVSTVRCRTATVWETRPSLPPLQQTYMTVRGEQDGTAGTARLALPAFKGDKGDPGDGFLWQGDRTSAEVATLREALGTDQRNWAYRNSDNDDLWV